ncbi:purine-cytosine permease family protein [Membranihabitans maritimus]|uniref:purine-cytosine permease family protein n=1 Tax=Membranihabitans maritimus TaxID=2904244 RepID=UPI0034E2B239
MLGKFKKRLNTVVEFEQVPVPEKNQKSWWSFLGMYAGEHTAGTEFVIGPLFVAHGVAAMDLIIGLVVGNLLAVLSWAFICAPIAVKERITLYYKMQKICGSRLTTIYNLVNALMFCFLAGSMIAVSATAVGIPFNLPMPTLEDWLPTSFMWVVIVVVIGMITTVIAMLGYNQVSRFANIAAPWMILIFISAAIAVLPEVGVNSASDFWGVAQERIWTGIPLEGQSKFTVWHVIFFAWFCNMAMHIGMADMSILRYARSWKAGFTSAAGMYVGHYIAWLASGILYAVFLYKSQNSLEFAPGPVAFYAAGVAGAICVMVAGWTTANPTIYRAGLAVQSILPHFKTWKITFIVGAVTTLAACFPALVMKLLEFVALYGLILMPMGAVIFIDFHLFPKFNLKEDYAKLSGIRFNWAAGLTWVLTLICCWLMSKFLGLEIFFLGLPGWFIAAILYVLLGKYYQSQKIATV